MSVSPVNNRAKNYEEYLNMHKQWEEQLHSWHEYLIGLGLTMKMKWNSPVYSYHNQNTIGLGAWKHKFTVTFFQGALIQDSNGILIASEERVKSSRQLIFSTFKEGKNPSHYEKMILEAIQLSAEGIQIPAERDKPIEIPKELEEVFQSHPELLNKFEQSSKTYRREYASYISSAKREATRKQRVIKVVEHLRIGKGLWEKYQKK